MADVLTSARTRLQTAGLYNWETAALIAITLFALVLRLVSLTNIPPNLSADEADNLQVILQIMADNGPGFFGIDWTQSPAFNLYLDSWFMGVFGDSLVGLRMASVVLTTLSLPVFYFVARQYELDKTAALGATLLLATCLWYLHFSRNGWYNVNVALYAILAILAATAAIRRGSLPLYAAAGAMAALGLYGHPSGRAITIALIAYLPFALLLHGENRRRLLIGYAIMLSTAFLLFLPHLNEVSDDWNGYNTRVAATYILNEQNRAQFGDKSVAQILAEQSWNNIRGFVLLDPNASYVGINARYIPGGNGFLDRFTGVLLWVGMVVSILRWRQTLLWWIFFIVMLFPTQVLSNATPRRGKSNRDCAALLPVHSHGYTLAAWLAVRQTMVVQGHSRRVSAGHSPPEHLQLFRLDEAAGGSASPPARSRGGRFRGLEGPAKGGGPRWTARLQRRPVARNEGTGQGPLRVGLWTEPQLGLAGYPQPTSEQMERPRAMPGALL